MNKIILFTAVLVFSLSKANAQCPTEPSAAIASLPFTQTSLNTATGGDVFSSGDGCGPTNFLSGDDYTFTYTPATDECINIMLSNTSSWVGIFVTDGCPNASGTNCIASAEENGGNPSITNLNVVAGTTYHFTISTWTAPQSTPFDINITNVCIPAPTPGNCTNMTINSTLYSQAGLTTCGFGDDFDNNDACGNFYMNGDDIVIEYIPTTSECVNIQLSNTDAYTGVFVLDGCAFDGGVNCLAQNLNHAGNPSIQGFNVTAGTSYFIHVSTNPSPQCTPFDIDIVPCPPISVCGNIATNDFCSDPITIQQAPNSFDGTTGGSLTVDENTALVSGGLFCGSLENNTWYIFTAESTTETFEFSNITGINCNLGIQAHVYEVVTDANGCCTGFTDMSNCYNPGNQTPGTVTTVPLNIGSQYYLMIDGYFGDACNFSVLNWQTLDVVISLSVSLTDFHGSSYRNGNKLEWTTESEKNNDYFILQKSSDGKSFTDVRVIKGNGNSNVTNDYNFMDTSDYYEMTYYRLKQFDFDGEFAYSKVVAIKSQEKRELEIFPIPFKSQFTIDLNDPSVENVVVEVLSQDGKSIYKQKITLNQGKTSIDLDDSIPNGLYFIKVYTGEDIIVKKILKANVN